jgi:hypothetical protein
MGIQVWTARCTQRRTLRTLCIVIAALGCLEFPYGTVQGKTKVTFIGETQCNAFQAL